VLELKDGDYGDADGLGFGKGKLTHQRKGLYIKYLWQV